MFILVSFRTRIVNFAGRRCNVRDNNLQPPEK